LSSSNHSEELASAKGGELQAAEYEAFKAAHEAFEAEKKAWETVRHEREEKEAAFHQVTMSMYTQIYFNCDVSLF
jgi:hypothetical protein